MSVKAAHVESLETTGHTSIDGLSERARRELFGTFSALVESEVEVLRTTRLDGTGRGFNRGGFREIPREKRGDVTRAIPKVSFIYDPFFKNEWDRRALSPGVADFIELCGEAYSTGMTGIRGVVRAIDQDPRYTGFSERALGDGQGSARLAVMQYNVPDGGDPSRRLFATHRDISLVSAHLGASHEGFYFEGPDEDSARLPFDPEDGSAVAFMGKQWNEMWPDSPMQAASHGAALPPELGSIQRSSAVLFLDEPGYIRIPQNG